MGFGLKGNLRWNLFLFSHIAHYILSCSSVESSSDSSGCFNWSLGHQISGKSMSDHIHWLQFGAEYTWKAFHVWEYLLNHSCHSCLHFPGRNLCYCWPLAHSAPNLGLILGCHVLTPCRPGRLERFVSITLGPNPRVHPWVPHDLRSHECK